MLRKVHIQNFRLFKDISLDLGQFNLVGGKNNAGKTALLEALFVHVGAHSPALTLKLHNFRGVGPVRKDPSAIWGWLFREHDMSRTVWVQSTDENDIERRLKMDIVQPDTVEVAASSEELTGEQSETETSTSQQQERLRFQYEDSEGNSLTTEGEIGEERVRFDTQAMVYPLSIYVSAQKRPGKEDVERYSSLEEKKQADPIISTLQIIEPRLERLVVSYAGNVPSLKADIGLDSLVPVAYMGDGIARLLSISIAVTAAENGLVMIDEIENGLHHSVMADVWKALQYLAKESNTQIVATTHSLECIRAAHEAFSSEEVSDFYFHRLDRRDAQVEVTSYDPDNLQSAIELDMEIR